MTPEEVLGLQSWHLLLPTRHVHCPPNHFFLDTSLIMWYRVSWVPLVWWINLNTKQNSIYHDCKILFEALFHEQPGTMADIAMPTLVNLIRSVQRHTINCMICLAHTLSEGIVFCSYLTCTRATLVLEAVTMPTHWAKQEQSDSPSSCCRLRVSNTTMSSCPLKNV